MFTFGPRGDDETVYLSNEGREVELTFDQYGYDTAKQLLEEDEEGSIDLTDREREQIERFKNRYWISMVRL